MNNILSKRIILFHLVFIILWLPGCDKDFLEKHPLDKISEATFWQNENDAMLALVGCYKHTYVHNSTDGWNSSMREGTVFHSDISQCKNVRAPGEIGADIHSNSQCSNTMWNLNYEGIARHNYFLENIDKADMDAAKKAVMIAEVRFLRAYRYFYLCQFFGGVPLITKTLTFEEANSVSRAPKQDVVSFILDEFTEAAQDLPLSRPSAEKGRIEKGAALAMKGRLLMAEERWAEAATTYEEVINSDVYDIDPRYKKLFEDEGDNSVETILALKFTENLDGDAKVQFQMPSTFAGGNEHAQVYKNFVDQFLMIDGKTMKESTLYDPDNPYANRDPRLEATVFLDGYTILPNGKTYHGHPDTLAAAGVTQGGITGFSYRKGWDPEYTGDVQSYGGDIAIIRYAEVLLSYLESSLEAGNNITQELLDETINRVRGRVEVNMPFVTEKDPGKLREIIRRERLCEFAFENLRYWDLIRWRIAEEVLNGTFYGVRITDDPESYTGGYAINDEGYLISITRRFEPHNYLWPIPQRERDINPNLEQNPGY